jgi:hypothetical protein
VASLIQHDVSVSIIDLVTVRQSSLYAEFLELLGRADLAAKAEETSLYAVTLRARKRPPGRPLFGIWFHPMQLGQTLPNLPIWLDVDLSILLELEKSYEETCRLLRIA